MTKMNMGIVAGLVFGAVAVGTMLPLKFPDRRTALTAAFASRFAIGFLVPAVHLPVPPTLAGALVGLLVSLPDAIVTKAYVPIFVIGIAGGALIGWIAGSLSG